MYANQTPAKWSDDSWLCGLVPRLRAHGPIARRYTMREWVESVFGRSPAVVEAPACHVEPWPESATMDPAPVHPLTLATYEPQTEAGGGNGLRHDGDLWGDE